jgi:hypothetical protein
MTPWEKCPSGYAQAVDHVCCKSDPKIEDLSGTFCGLVYKGMGSRCGRLSLGQYPKGYLAFNDEAADFHTCYKG